MGTGPHGAPTLALGPTCTELMGALDTHPLSRLLWRRLKPLVLGKVLFTPDTPFTRQIMAQVTVRGALSPSLCRGGESQATGEP